jgi:hypothetical protein
MQFVPNKEECAHIKCTNQWNLNWKKVGCKSYTELINTLNGQNALFLYVKPGVTYTSRLYRLNEKRPANGDTTPFNF